MLLPIFILCLSHFVLASPVQTEYDVEDVEQLKHHFNNFKIKYNKSYTPEEEELRLSYFKMNLKEIIELRKRNPFARFDIHQYVDRSPEEKKHLACFKGGKIGNELGKCLRGSPVPPNTTIVPDHLDYREKNAVTPVQNQGHCGACWAFSATGAVEGAFALQFGPLFKLSEQQLVDCDQESDGCDGGLVLYAFSTLVEQDGLEAAIDYPYNARDNNECAYDVAKITVHVSSCELYESINEDTLQKFLLDKGPLAIAIDPEKTYGYKGGVITDCDYHELGHAALLIGYGEENGIPYWLIKNSWGENWGEEGYLRIQRGKRCLGIGEIVNSVGVKYFGSQF